jgi:hypothetical protein
MHEHDDGMRAAPLRQPEITYHPERTGTESDLFDPRSLIGPAASE